MKKRLRLVGLYQRFFFLLHEAEDKVKGAVENLSMRLFRVSSTFSFYPDCGCLTKPGFEVSQGSSCMNYNEIPFFTDSTLIT